MNHTCRLFLLIGCWLLPVLIPLHAQQREADSLLQQIQQPGIKNTAKSRIMSRLAALYVNRDTAKGLDYGRQALALAGKTGDAASLSYVYSYLASVYIRTSDERAVTNAVDSAMWYAGKTNDRLVKGLAWYRKGWLENIDNNIDEAVLSWQRALDFLDGQPEGTRFCAGIYYLYFGIYAERGDLGKEQYYARLALKAAQQASPGDILSAAWQINGTAFLDRFDIYKDSVLLDSALSAFKNAIAIAMPVADSAAGNRAPLALSALFTAQVYMDHFPPWAKDSVIKYVNIALANTDTSVNKRMLINCYTILSKYALQDGRPERAEQMLQCAQAAFDVMDPPDYYIAESLYKELADLAGQKGDKSRALQYYKLYMDYYKKEFDAKQFTTTRRLEARYQAEKKEKEILLLRGKEAFRRKQNYLYIGIILVAISGLVFMFRAYHFRLRYSLQREKILMQEKEEAFLQSRLKEEEAILLEMEKHEAELQSRLKEEETARLQAERQLLKAQQEQLQKEVLAGALQVEHKNELLQNLKEQLLKKPDENASQLEKIFHNESLVDEDFEKVKSEFKDLHPEFFNRLQQKAGQKLTALDLKYCAYIYLKLSSKQIASLLHVEPKSVRMTKYRIKQKLVLTKDETLENYLNNIV